MNAIPKTLTKLSQHKLLLILLGAASLVLAFPPIHLVPLVLFFPVALNLLWFRCQSPKEGFVYGFLCSVLIMVGAFYWVVYVSHEIGRLPWALSVLVFLGFCGFGALNFPIFIALAHKLNRQFSILKRQSPFPELWFAIGLPSLFSMIEFAIPKLFPWYAGHCLYLFPWLIQIAEITGSLFFTFTLYSIGSTASLYLFYRWGNCKKPNPFIWSIPLSLIVISIGFSATVLTGDLQAGKRPIRLGMVQPNIGSLIKVQARDRIGGKVGYVVDKYLTLTEEILASGFKPDLILWPETAMPFYLHREASYARRIYQKVRQWNVPLISGAYSPDPEKINVDYNTAFLLDPVEGNIRMDLYRKNILLAFGEYFPFGDTFPKLYEWFPQVSHFGIGREQTVFVLKDGTRIGATICYEAIVPSFYRKVAKMRTQAIVNLTNDSWFGPTSEPSQHAALSVFRTVETRSPLFRVTNTGISFVVDSYGYISGASPVYEEATVTEEIWIPDTPPPLTLYLKWGDWFVLTCLIILFGLLWVSKRYAPLPI